MNKQKKGSWQFRKTLRSMGKEVRQQQGMGSQLAQKRAYGRFKQAAPTVLPKWHKPWMQWFRDWSSMDEEKPMIGAVRMKDKYRRPHFVTLVSPSIAGKVGQ